MFSKLLINSLRKTINQLEEEKTQLEAKNKELEHDNILLLDTNRDQRAKINDLENNVEFLTNNLSAQKRKKLGL